jgi:outer membrane protein assembly factor BamE (lipoprotein component of BamABCDE complex)
MKVKILHSFILIFFSVSCSTDGTRSLKDESHATIHAKIKEGVTTKDQIIIALGTPTDTSFTENGLEILKYEYTRYTPKLRNFIPYNFFSHGQDGKSKEVVILLDEKNIVKKLVMNEAKVERRIGIIE